MSRDGIPKNKGSINIQWIIYCIIIIFIHVYISIQGIGIGAAPWFIFNLFFEINNFYFLYWWIYFTVTNCITCLTDLASVSSIREIKWWMPWNSWNSKWKPKTNWMQFNSCYSKIKLENGKVGAGVRRLVVIMFVGQSINLLWYYISKRNKAIYSNMISIYNQRIKAICDIS